MQGSRHSAQFLGQQTGVAQAPPGVLLVPAAQAGLFGPILHRLPPPAIVVRAAFLPIQRLTEHQCRRHRSGHRHQTAMERNRPVQQQGLVEQGEGGGSPSGDRRPGRRSFSVADG